MAEKYNLKNPAVKRILQEGTFQLILVSLKHLKLECKLNLMKQLNMLHNGIGYDLVNENKGWELERMREGRPADSEFEGGIYHGRIQLPAEYPFKPPSFMLLTPNGRFETQTKICLSISNHHPEHWQPSWSVRTALVALIAFMPTSPNGALGSLDYKKEERRSLAIKSREAPPRFGTPERQKLIDEIHEYMLSKAPPVPQLSPSQAPEEQHLTNEASEAQVNSQNSGADADAFPAVQDFPDQPEDDRIVEEQELPATATTTTNPNPARTEASKEAPSSTVPRNQVPQRQNSDTTRVQKPDDRLFTLAAIGLTIAIVVLLLKKFIKSTEHGAVFMNGS
ncbi:ubiquitin-conjugating enzyme E2 32 [Senna tora]|uniref:Ubiquitin-conjugating enzyme E2 32 n=1 Tax=Senna tora TaxID=362788 RepID=A0A834SPZ7_9FABA|nr:ubiquitin-conjugating enzyme E2 32 [Senna tora]